MDSRNAVHAAPRPASHLLTLRAVRGARARRALSSCFFGLSIGDKFVGLRCAFRSMRGVLFQQTDVGVSLRLGTRFFLASLRKLFRQRSHFLVGQIVSGARSFPAAAPRRWRAAAPRGAPGTPRRYAYPVRHSGFDRSLSRTFHEGCSALNSFASSLLGTLVRRRGPGILGRF